MKLLHVDSSAKHEWSNSRALGQHFLQELRTQQVAFDVDYLDLTADVPGHVTEAFTMGTYAPEADRTDAMKAALAQSDGFCKRVLAADAYVFAMPMYNWSVPSVFKAFIDNITRLGVTFSVGDDGSIDGKLGGKNVLFLTTRGGDLRPGGPYEAMDALTPVLKAAFGFLGVATPDFVDAQPLQFADQDARSQALERARADLSALAVKWAGAPRV